MFDVTSGLAPSPALALVPKPGQMVPYSNPVDVKVFAPPEIEIASSVLDDEKSTKYAYHLPSVPCVAM